MQFSVQSRQSPLYQQHNNGSSCFSADYTRCKQRVETNCFEPRRPYRPLLNMREFFHSTEDPVRNTCCSPVSWVDLTRCYSTSEQLSHIAGSENPSPDLHPEFVESLRVLFDILDTSRTGRVRYENVSSSLSTYLAHFQAPAVEFCSDIINTDTSSFHSYLWGRGLLFSSWTS